MEVERAWAVGMSQMKYGVPSITWNPCVVTDHLMKSRMKTTSTGNTENLLNMEYDTLVVREIL